METNATQPMLLTANFLPQSRPESAQEPQNTDSGGLRAWYRVRTTIRQSGARTRSSTALCINGKVTCCTNCYAQTSWTMPSIERVVHHLPGVVQMGANSSGAFWLSQLRQHNTACPHARAMRRPRSAVTKQMRRGPFGSRRSSTVYSEWSVGFEVFLGGFAGRFSRGVSVADAVVCQRSAQ